MTYHRPEDGPLSRRSVLGLIVAAPVLTSAATTAWPDRTTVSPDIAVHDLADRIRAIVQRTVLPDPHWAMQFRAPGNQRVVYELNPHQPVIGASSNKVFREGTALSALGPNYRFRTPIYRTGPVVGGVLHGDLVLVASGDLLLSGRLRPDGTLRLPTPDHTYTRSQGGSVPIGGDPLQEIRQMAGQIAASGIRHPAGRRRHRG